ncbi:MAG: OsmC family protein [Actinobacteria bacterium]|jgi:putative redox protein|nr:OsmC family protein [Actinomycetota bacterium]MDA2995287.1 OsmC family protein [Actinomycetota bacterium]
MNRTPYVRAVESGNGRYVNEVTMGSHRLISDEPERLGGDNLGPNPLDLVGAALAACTSMTIRMYAERKGWEIQNLTVLVDHQRDRGHDTFTRFISFDGDLDEEARERLIDISHRCPVHRIMEGSATILTETGTPTAS